jgi:hypothetical protein
MAFRRLFLFVEGDDDERFFRRLLPLLGERYDHVDFVQSSRLPKSKLEAFVRSVQAMGADYLVVRDLDDYPCSTAAKEALRDRHRSLDPERIQIVHSEIESWYCAGVPRSDRELGGLGIVTCADTTGVTKEIFHAALGELGGSSLAAKIAMLESFDLALAARRNASFRYFLRKHLGLGAISGPEERRG